MRQQRKQWQSIVPLSAHVPISAPTAIRMRMAGKPAAIPSTTDARTADHVDPFL
jgi:hypothetical protein